MRTEGSHVSSAQLVQVLKFAWQLRQYGSVHCGVAGDKGTKGWRGVMVRHHMAVVDGWGGVKVG